MAEHTQSDINPFTLLKGNSSKSTKESSVPPRTNDYPAEDRNHPSNIQQEVAEPRKVIYFNPRELYYDMSGEKFMVIFNHRTFRKTRFYDHNPPTDRDGTDEDVRRLKEVFGKLKFKIFVHNDKTYDELWSILCEMQKQNYSTASCLSIVILTHGEGDGLLCAADRRYFFSDVLKKFESHPTLAAKPKLFFIQACRGKKVDEGVSLAIDGPKKGNKFVVPSHADFLIMRSSVNDYRGYRDARGSWLIQELCNVVEHYCKELDLLQMITLVHNKVAFAYTTYTNSAETNDKVAMPETTFRLTRFVKLDV